MDHSLNSLNNFDFLGVVLPECTQKVARSIFWPLLVTWMKNIEPGLRTLCLVLSTDDAARELELEH
ncbi:Uncharacterised protein [Escherichia coli]|uniref:Uncharacterized protein n=1 Tax=Escherichia coli TaxID=562 RepID=A0A376ZHT3_ECOLX|nr:Uncharacterised protein [Escherichia coli]